MNLKRSERDWYVLDITVEPPLTGAWQASFDNGATWHNGSQTSGGWAWLLAGPDFDAAAVDMDGADTVAVLTASTTPLLRCAENPVLDVESGPRIWLT